MDVIIKLNNQAAGRDKLARVVQYSSKFIWNTLQQSKTDRYTIDQLKRLESTCSSFRKLLRFGKCVDSLYAVVSTFNYPDVFLRITLTLSKISNSLFLFADHIIWLARSGFLKNVDSNRWTDISNRYWLITIILNLVRDLYEIQNILFHQKDFILGNRIIGSKTYHNYISICEKAFSVIKLRKDILTDTIKNLSDLWIPLTALGRVKLNPGTVGLLGVISSTAALFALVHPPAKLIPA